MDIDNVKNFNVKNTPLQFIMTFRVLFLSLRSTDLTISRKLFHMRTSFLPVTFSSLIVLVTKFVEGRKMPHLLFHGPPGTGKTSCIIAVAKKLYGPNYKNMTLELNASDDRGINVVREQIKSFCSTQQLMSKGIKLVILDECDSMTGPAQFALRRSKI